jgi:hypothetical protein
MASAHGFDDPIKTNVFMLNELIGNAKKLVSCVRSKENTKTQPIRCQQVKLAI